MTHYIKIEGSEVAFSCEDSETVLDAAARNGIELPYSCRKGVCGNCRGLVLEGQLVPGTTGGSSEAGIHSDNEHLFCHARAASDLVIRPRSWQQIDPNARKTLQAKVFRIAQPASDVTVLQLRFGAGVRAKFLAGQYLQVLLPDGQRRAFSMANAPHESDCVQLHIRHVPGGRFSMDMLPSLKVGDPLQLELPHGDFWLREVGERPLIMVAGGTGFAPIKSIIDHLVRRKIERPLSLYWGSRQPEGLYAPEVIAKWLQMLPGMRYEPVVSDPDLNATWSGRTGLVHEAVLADYLDLSKYDIYACGAPAMVAALRRACIEQRGLPEDHFFSDSFVSQSN
ncbi:MAG: 2Fe-2S iron-sulfur cluster binding domain-containing protein [Gammaproteobacteria bacterium]|nr:2Fe-2S iron-sulfur cluster binding domain-containing protein [Gammaproteobacteria bacterium]MBU0788188.1 2Fe-2S iron-sulfur cluster binding domain-containing protein [Gammaproteobacteria bacterium]MBU0815315.1 2Fe-2S iron-sulfur cluster binding domain-containing protein [Gammaproteobacteria bacterium]MBU1785577.1 2Fe-2S iron-sulfur cluster binding domain-containing protein [Gammaproteobacteria bacterium]